MNIVSFFKQKLIPETLSSYFLKFMAIFTLLINPVFSADTQALNQKITAFMEKNSIPGAAFAFYDGEKAWISTYGVASKHTGAPVTKETIFEIASVTKVFTSTALALHVLAGDMSLNDPLSRFLPALNQVHGPISQVTLLNLATHSSSLPRVAPNRHGRVPNRKEIIEFIQNWQPQRPIGSHYLYSNLAFGLIGYALENVENRSFEEVMLHDILNPLDMRHTFTEVPERDMHLYADGYGPKGFKSPRRADNHLPGGGALRSTADDLLKFLMANLNIEGPKKLRQAMQNAQQPFFKVSDTLTLGLAWQRVPLDKMLVVDKNGGLPGFSSYIGMIPEKKIGVVILMNKSKAKSTKLGRHLLKIMAF